MPVRFAPSPLAPVTVPSESFIIDPTSEDAGNTELAINTGDYKIISADLSPPPRVTITASSADTEGDPFVSTRYQNREIKLKMRVYGSDGADLHANLGALQQKVGKINRENGTLKWTSVANIPVVFDLIGADVAVTLDQAFGTHSRTEVDLTFQAMPFGRGPEVTHSDNTTTTGACLIFTVPSIGGDGPALGRLVVDDDQGADQFWFVWGQQSRYYDSSANAALFYEAEGRTAQGGSATNAGTATPSGSSVMRNTDLTPSYQSILSTQATGGGAHLQHVGDFQVFARLYRPTGNTGAVSVAFEWAEGDFLKASRNAPVEYGIDDREGAWCLADLGQVHLKEVVTGTQRWEGRLLAKSTVVGDEIDVDYLMFVPVTEGYGEARAVRRFDNPTSFSARDEFNQSTGALDYGGTPKTAPTGGTWGGAGDAVGFNVSAAANADRGEQSDADINTGRYGILGSSTFTNVFVQTDIHRSAVPSANNFDHRYGVIARYTDTSNWLMAVHDTNFITPGASVYTIKLLKRVSGTVTTLGSYTLFPQEPADFYTIRILADAAGRVHVWWFPAGGISGKPIISTADSVLATGGTLATGKIGIYDAWTGNLTLIRAFDNFLAAVPTTDAAISASQSLEVRHDRCIRESSTNAVWSPVSDYEGAYLRPIPAGVEGRTARFIVKASRNDPTTMTDPSIDDISARLYTTPRYLVVPKT